MNLISRIFLTRKIHLRVMKIAFWMLRLVGFPIGLDQFQTDRFISISNRSFQINFKQVVLGRFLNHYHHESCGFWIESISSLFSLRFIIHCVFLTLQHYISELWSCQASNKEQLGRTTVLFRNGRHGLGLEKKGQGPKHSVEFSDFSYY